MPPKTGHGRDRFDDHRKRDDYNRGGHRDRNRDSDRDRDRDHRDSYGGRRDRDRDRDNRREQNRDVPPRASRVDAERQKEREGSGKPSTPGPTDSAKTVMHDEPNGQEEGEENDGEPMDSVDEEEAAMRAMMGFSGFDTTKVCFVVVMFRLV